MTIKEFYYANSRKYVEAVLNDYLVWNTHRPVSFEDWYNRHHG